MRNIMAGILAGLIIAAVVVFCVTQQGRDTRQAEVKNALSEAIENSMETVMSTNSYSINDKEEFVADFLESLLSQVESTSTLTVNILKADNEKGLLSVEVIEQYKHPNGKDGTVSVDRTVVFDQKEDEAPPEDKQITYEVDGEVYKTYEIRCNEPLILPAQPISEDKVFSCWKDKNTGAVADINTMIADKDYTFEAVMVNH